jgi:ribonuclease HI
MNLTKHKRQPGKSKLKTFHVYGESARPNGVGSGYAWVMADTGKKQVERVDGLTKEEAEYEGLIAALEYVGDGSTVQICMDAPEVCDQFMYPFPVNDPRLNALLSKACNLEKEKALEVQTRSILQRRNLAAELFDAAMSRSKTRRRS